ncbi:Ser/Thr protein kinase RdoA (MazF antagonist) [Leucobacter exalbidus]|uniref:Ser/Thr protein kinase RdoA (MazF antagonist) n=1 Tax=Leucobacter exalbidus TaxID=662960 RepID=A0A940T4L0_9MICO|nr:phosphotransferase [Leucobacter exalbidus]MBP1327347.1 Ser/Thr protein kinase RdoA (MazF antagonist) [Leucobacter exalbidus]
MLSAAQARPVLLRTHAIRASSLTVLGSELASTFRAETDTGAYAVKMQASGPRDFAVQLWRAEIADRLASLGHRVPEQVHTPDGALAALDEAGSAAPVFVSVTRWVDAVPYASAVAEPGAGARFGAHLGATAALLQRDLAGFPGPPRPLAHTWAAHTTADTIAQHTALLPAGPARDIGEAALLLHGRFIAPVAASLPRALVHQDLHDDNVLVGADGKIAAIIDFDDMLVGWRVAEPAIAAAYLARAADDPLAALRAVADGWQSELPFTTAEAETFAPIAAMRLALNTVVWASRMSGDRAGYAAARAQGSAAAFQVIAATLASPALTRPAAPRTRAHQHHRFAR